MKLINYFLAISVLVFLVYAAPPELRSIEGTVRYADSSQVDLGTYVLLISSIDELLTQTYGPGGNTGFYATNNLLSVDDEYITVYAYNSSSYGVSGNNATPNPGVTVINVNINLTRPSELSANIISPSSNSYVVVDNTLELLVSLTNIGGSLGNNCSVLAAVSDSNVFSSLSFNASAGNIAVGESTQVMINLSADNLGSSNINVTAACNSDNINFESLNFDEITNVQVISSVPELHAIEGFVKYANQVQVPSGVNVTIRSNNTGDEILTFTSGPPGYTGFYATAQLLAYDGEFVTVRAENGTHFGLANTTIVASPGVTVLNVTLDDLNPYGLLVQNVLLEDSLDNPKNELVLNPNVNTSFICNATILSEEGYAAINEVNATIYLETRGLDLDNDNFQYTNTSCTTSGGLGDAANYTCGFTVRHYANNGTWICNISAVDSFSNTGSNTDTSVLQPLFSFDLSNELLTYGLLATEVESPELNINITNSGNMNLSMYFYGYGGFVDDNNNSFNCAGNNVSIDYHRYSQSSNSWASKTPLNYTSENSGISVLKQINSTNVTNSTYWQVLIPALNPIIELGTCNGTVVFEAFTLS